MIEEKVDDEYTEILKIVLTEIDRREGMKDEDKEYMKFDFKNILEKYGKEIKDKKGLTQRILSIIEGKENNPDFFHMMFNELGDFGSEKFRNLTNGYNEYYNIDIDSRLPISQTFVVALDEIFGREFMLKSLYGGSLEENIEALEKKRKSKGILSVFIDIDKFLSKYPTDETQSNYVPTEESKEQVRDIFIKLKKAYKKTVPPWSDNIICKFCYDKLMGTNTSKFLDNNEKIEDIYINPTGFGFIQISGGTQIEINKGVITAVRKYKKQEPSGEGRE